LDPLDRKRQQQLVAQQLSLPGAVNDGAALLDDAKEKNLDESFLGNPQNLKTVVESNLVGMHIFSVFHSLQQTLIEKALVKIESIGKEDKGRLHTLARKRRDLLVMAVARLEEVEGQDFDLTADRVVKINNVGIFNVFEDGTFLYHFDLFKDFFLALFLIHKHSLGKNGNVQNFEQTLKVELDTDKFAGAVRFISSFKVVSENQQTERGRNRLNYGYSITDLNNL